MIDLLSTSVELGFIYCVLVFGVYLTFRVLDFPDLTVDGSFVTGAAATALLIKSGAHGEAALLGGFAAGCLAGLITGLLHVKLGIGKILSSILSLGILYTVNLRLMGGPNISLLNTEGVANLLKATASTFSTIVALAIIVVIVKFLLDWFLSTEFGLALRATGSNEETAKSFGINIGSAKLIGVSLANGFVGVSGGLLAQYQGFVDVNMGVGLIILGLAALMLGEAIVHPKWITFATIGVIVGGVSYELIVNIALYVGLAPTDLKFITALIVIASLVVASKKKYAAA